MKSALLSKIAMCVCPPAIVATTAVTVPPVRRAVHHLTAPAHAPAKPRRVFNAAYDCTPTAVPLTAAPSALTAVAPTDVTETPPAVTSLAPTAFAATPAGFSPVALVSPPFAGPVNPLLVTPNTPVVPPSPPAVVPEASTWAMTITGFGAIGWALRRRPRAVEMA